MKKHFLWKTYEVVCLKELSGAINWEQLSGANYLEGNYRGQLSRRPFSGGQFSWDQLLGGGQLSRGQLYGGNDPGGGQFSWGTFVRWTIIRGTIIQGEIVRGKLSGGGELYWNQNFTKTNIKSPVPESATLLKKRIWHSCFPVNFAKFLRAPFLKNTSRWLLLKIWFDKSFSFLQFFRTH